MKKVPKFVVIGGGTGSFAVLSGLKHQAVEITALVSMADDGGSTGVLRDELGVLPPGDVRQCLVALSSAPEDLRQLFNYRFAEGSLAGHSFGNLFLSAMEKMTHNFGEAVRLSSEILRIKGRVLPITLDSVHLRMKLADHRILRGQRHIDDSPFGAQAARPQLYLEPHGRLNPAAAEAIAAADVIVIAPGDIYTSIGPLLVVDGVAEALAGTRAKVLYICNLVVKPGQTNGFTVADHVAEVERFAGGPIVDVVLYNTAKPSPVLLQKYAKAGELLVAAKPAEFAQAHYRAVGKRLLANQPAKAVRGDSLAASGRRSFIRHDATLLAGAIMQSAEPRGQPIL